MHKAPLRDDLRRIEQGLIHAMQEGLHGWRSDLQYPASYSDYESLARGVMERFDVIPRIVKGEFTFPDKEREFLVLTEVAPGPQEGRERLPNALTPQTAPGSVKIAGARWDFGLVRRLAFHEAARIAAESAKETCWSQALHDEVLNLLPIEERSGYGISAASRTRATPEFTPEAAVGEGELPELVPLFHPEITAGFYWQWLVDKHVERLKIERDLAIAQRDEADRRAGSAERSLERLRESEAKRDRWLAEQKDKLGYGHNISFDVVWQETLAKLAAMSVESEKRQKLAEGFADSLIDEKRKSADFKPGELERLRDALAMMYDKWENGHPCQEATEDGECIDGTSLGNAFNLSQAEEQTVLNLIVTKPEPHEQACANCGKPYRAHLLHDHNKCSPNSDGGWFPKSIADAARLGSLPSEPAGQQSLHPSE